MAIALVSLTKNGTQVSSALLSGGSGLSIDHVGGNFFIMGTRASAPLLAQYVEYVYWDGTQSAAYSIKTLMSLSNITPTGIAWIGGSKYYLLYNTQSLPPNGVLRQFHFNDNTVTKWQQTKSLGRNTSWDGMTWDGKYIYAVLTGSPYSIRVYATRSGTPVLDLIRSSSLISITGTIRGISWARGLEHQHKGKNVYINWVDDSGDPYISLCDVSGGTAFVLDTFASPYNFQDITNDGKYIYGTY